jgi:hypothetical protein
MNFIPSTKGRLSDGAVASSFAFLTTVLRTPPSPVKSMVSAMAVLSQLNSERTIAGHYSIIIL